MKINEDSFHTYSDREMSKKIKRLLLASVCKKLNSNFGYNEYKPKKKKFKKKHKCFECNLQIPKRHFTKDKKFQRKYKRGFFRKKRFHKNRKIWKCTCYICKGEHYANKCPECESKKGKVKVWAVKELGIGIES